jgi:hypothetical protein
VEPPPAEKKAEKKGAPAFTNEQLAMLNGMMKVSPDPSAGRAASGGMSMGARGQVNMGQLQTQQVAAHPTLAQLLYGGKR